MKVPISWLKDYVDVTDTPENLAQRLTFSGMEVEGIARIGGDFTGLVVAEVKSVARHPGADKLTVCQVFDGQETLEVVCGAPNVQAGGKYPFAPIGVTLPGGLKIKKAKIRGVVSHGMLCAEDELGLSEDHAGLMTLDATLAVGTPLAEVLGPPETVLDLEITPNRPDCLSLIGVAREVAALYGVQLRIPAIALRESGRPAADEARVTVRDPLACPRYTARVLRGVKIMPSPDWMQRRLKLAGVRPINNIVDITNYVMLECGQPLHAFDQDLLQGGIIVRRIAPGEGITTLDEQKRELPENSLVIADEARAVALAGIMGGAGSEIRPETARVLLESACFNAPLIRTTSRKLGLTSESSYRFARGVDIGNTEWASRRAALLMQELAGGELAPGVVDVYPEPRKQRELSFRFRRIPEVVGLPATPEAIIAVFESLQLPVLNRTADACTVGIPTFRGDLEREIDLVEEYARIHGLDKIPLRAPQPWILPGATDESAPTATIRARLVALGLRETLNYSLVSPALLDLFNPADAAERVVLPHPLSADQSVLRTSLLPQIMVTLGYNRARQIEEAMIFEIGRVFRETTDVSGEEERVAIGLMGPVGRSALAKRAEVDDEEMLLWLKGVLSALLEALRFRDVRFEAADSPACEAGRALNVIADGQIIGCAGLARRVVREEWRINTPVGLAEIALRPLAAHLHDRPVLQDVPVYPSIRRDIAFIVPEAVRHADVLQVARKAAPADLEVIGIFDIFRGKDMGAGRKSLAYGFIFRSRERTLTDDEANRYRQQIMDALRADLNAEIREQ